MPRTRSNRRKRNEKRVKKMRGGGKDTNINNIESIEANVLYKIRDEQQRAIAHFKVDTDQLAPFKTALTFLLGKSNPDSSKIYLTRQVDMAAKQNVTLTSNQPDSIRKSTELKSGFINAENFLTGEWFSNKEAYDTKIQSLEPTESTALLELIGKLPIISGQTIIFATTATEFWEKCRVPNNPVLSFEKFHSEGSLLSLISEMFVLYTIDTPDSSYSRNKAYIDLSIIAKIKRSMKQPGGKSTRNHRNRRRSGRKGE
jgi:hypothetical protein